MTDSSPAPDVVVGVDFGMTSTGVAYSIGPEWTRPETIQNWPGNMKGSIADKVDTKIAYDRSNNVLGWGFNVDAIFLNEGERYEEFFKLYLDPDFHDEVDSAPQLQEVRRWFVDYLSCLYKTIDRHLHDTIPWYHSKVVEFKFSVPTTWKNPAMIAEIEQLIRNAGFAKYNVLHKADISLTEAEAAAVYASKMQYGSGDTILVCDAGGGTSDVNILKVVSSGVGQTELTPLSWVEGKAIGSTLIDFHVEKLISERLEQICDHLSDEPGRIAHRMLREGSRFESFKCNLGDEAMDLPTLRITIPNLRPGFNMLPIIENSQMLISKQELQDIFNKQIDRICALIDEQLSQLSRSHPYESVTYLVLSGGFGSSPYLQKVLKQRYLLGRSSYACAKDMQILRAPKPQLAVCHGLVLDRVQQIKHKRAVYKERFCRNSYGIVVKAEYDPNLHAGELTRVDPRDNKIWVLNQIDWFIKQGQRVSVTEGVKQHYSTKVKPGREHVPWETQIVMSTLPAAALPSSLNKPGAKRLCKVESRLPQDMKMKNRRWYQSRNPYLKAEFDIQVLIGPADLKFQTLGRDGILSQNHENIDVEWFLSGDTKVADHVLISELAEENLSAERPSVNTQSKMKGKLRDYLKRRGFDMYSLKRNEH